MISKITAENFKGRSFEHEIGQRTIITGPKGSGKSSITQAIQLLILGYVPAEKPKKRPGDIFSAFGPADGKKMTVGVQQGKSLYQKEYRLSPSGSVSIKHVIGTGKYSEVDFKASAKDLPAPYDLSSFMTLSDQRKIDTLFELFPPAGDVIKLQAEIDAIKDQISATEKSKDSIQGTIARLSKSKSEIAMPSGTLAEVQQEISRTEAEYRLTSQNLHRAEAEAAEEKRQEEKKAKEDEQKKLDAERQAKTPTTSSEPTSPPTYPEVAEQIRNMPEMSNGAVLTGAITGPSVKSDGVNYGVVTGAPQNSGITAIMYILESMARTGCDTCAASLVAKREIKRLKGGA